MNRQRFIVRAIGPSGMEHMRHWCNEDLVPDVESYAMEQFPGCAIQSAAEDDDDLPLD